MKTQSKMIFKNAIAVLVLLSLANCQSVSWLKQNKSEPLNRRINFTEIYEFAKLAELAYETDGEISEAYPNLLVTQELSGYESKYFITKDDSARTLYIAIRGTANVRNGIIDLKYQKDKDPRHNIYLHRGFGEATRELYTAIQPVLEPFRHQQYRLSLTGHSLGGAMAVILMMYLVEDNYSIDRVITFGQPKVTNEDGIEKYRKSPLLRVINDKDPVPLVPPLTPISAMNGMYRHFGAQTVLLPGQHYVYLDEELAKDPRVTSYWTNLGIEEDRNEHNVTEHLAESLDDHRIVKYVEMIETKIEEQLQVPFKERAEFR